MITAVRGICRDENAKELNELLKRLVKDLEMENEVITDTIMDMTLNHSERKDKSFWEVIRNPENYQELITLESRNSTLEYIISELRNILYSDYEEIPLQEEKETEPRLKPEQCRDWLGMEVKPLILKGTDKQQDVSKALGIGASTISTRVKSGYGANWEMYVAKVKKGIY